MMGGMCHFLPLAPFFKKKLKMKLKNIFVSCLMSLVGLTASAQTTLWSASDQENGDELGWYGIGKEKFPATLTIGDVISVNDVVATGSWNWVNLCAIDNTSYEWWSPGTKLTEKTGNALPSTIFFVVTEEMIAAINDLGLFFECGTWIDGGGSTFKAKTIIYTPKTLVSSINIQTLATPKEVSWWNENMPADAFAAAQVGDMLTITLVENKEDWGPWVNLRNTSGEGSDMLNDNFTAPGMAKFVLDATTLEVAKAGNLSVQGGHYTYSSIDLVYAPTVNVSSAEYATFSYNEKLDLTGIDAYAVTVDGESAKLTSIEGKKVAANIGVILYKAGGGAVRIPFASGETDEITNSLIGTATGVVVNPSDAYVLANKEPNGVGFYKLKSGQTIAANKAYLNITAGAREFIGFFNNDSEITNIAEVSRKKIEVNGNFFDLQGRKVTQPKKGLYIVNGKKIVIK